MNTNILSLSFRQVAATDKSPAFLAAELRIDDKLVGEKYTVDLRQLAKALTSEGEHFIFTCGCGEPACVGIHEGFRTWIEGDIVAVEGNLPKGMECSWKLSATQAKEAVAEALRSVEQVASAMSSKGGFPIGPDGLDAEDVKVAISRLS